MLKEEKILLKLCVAHTQKDFLYLKDLTKKDFNWELFIKLTEKNSLSALLYKNLTKYRQLDFFPEIARQRLQNIYYYNLARNVFLLGQIKPILEAFYLENLKVIGLKGLFLSEYLYGDIDIRPATDIDLLVDANDLERIDKILSSFGYVQPPYFKDFVLKKETTPINSLVYKNYTSEIFIHLHTHIINTTLPIEFFVEKISTKDILQKANPIILWDIKTYTLQPYHLLLQLLHHGFCHNFDKFLLWLDIRQVLFRFKDLFKKESLKEELEKFYSWRLANFVFLKLEKIFDCVIDFKEKDNFYDVFDLKINAMFFYFILLPNLKYKLNFIKKFFLPSKYVIAQNLYKSIDKVRFYDYFLRANLFLDK